MTEQHYDDNAFNREMSNSTQKLVDMLNLEVESPKDESSLAETADEYHPQEAQRLRGGENIIYYGVPGSGKSYTIQQKCPDPRFMERVVFHPDYTYSDFTGQILPRVEDGTVKYQFTPGPFTTILKKAWEDSAHMYYLVIEELNRGNAPAIFGDIFQLLDREEDGTGSYEITNGDIAEAVWGDKERKVRIPSNLSILATMNTSDQNVFTLDNAFQRRWKMKLIRNDFNPNGGKAHDDHLNHPVCGTSIKWGEFAKLVNEQIGKSSREMIGSEDKRLGVFFARDAELDSRDEFAEKVLKYLWDDAFKMDRDSIFQDRFNTFEDLIAAYTTAENPLKAVLKENIYNGMDENLRD